MSGQATLTGKLTELADAIREKSKKTGKLTLDQMAAEIGNLKTSAELTFSTVRGTAPSKAVASFAKPTAPTAAGYTFTGWYKDAALTTAFDFAAEAETATAYAKWKINQPTVSHPNIDADGTTSYTLGTVTPAGSGQTVQYSADNKTWQSTCPKQSADGTYTTYWRITATDCDALTGSFTTLVQSDVVTDAIVSKLTAAASSRSLSALSYSELGLVSQSLEKKGTASKAYTAAVNCAKAGAYRTLAYSGSTVYMTLVDVLHSTDNSGNKLGLDWMLSGGAPSTSALMGTSNGITTMQMNSSNTNSGGWGSSAGRTTLNGSIYNNLPAELRNIIKARKVPYGATYNSIDSSVSYTNDKLWLMSYSEVYGKGVNGWMVTNGWFSGEHAWMDNEGDQLMWFKNAGVKATSSSSNYSALVGGSAYRWLRSCYPDHSGYFGSVYCGSGSPSNNGASNSCAVFPCFSI